MSKRVDSIVNEANENIYNIYKLESGTFKITNDTVVEYTITYTKTYREAVDYIYNIIDGKVK